MIGGSRPWNLEGLMAARMLQASGSRLPHIAQALDRRADEIDMALWALLGRTPAQALQRLNGWGMGEGPQDPAVLRELVLDELAGGAAEASAIAARLKVSELAVDEVLRALALQGLVDAHDPPQPAGRRAMRWFARPEACA